MLQITIKKGSTTIDTKYFDEDIEIITIGRHSSNDIQLRDPKRNISRQHAAIIMDEKDNYYIRDIGSRNHTEVNNNVVYRHPLNSEDIIKVGDYSLIFNREAGEREDEDLVPVVSERDIQKYESRTSEEDYVNSTKFFTTHKISDDRLLGIADLKKNIVLNIANRLGSRIGISGICDELLHASLQIITFEKGYIAIVQDNKQLKIITKYGIAKRRGESIPRLSIEVKQKVLDKGLSYITGNYCNLKKAVMCLPIMNGNKACGLLYLENSSKDFSEEDEKVLSFLAESASLCIMSVLSKTAPKSKRSISSDDTFIWKAAIVGNVKSPGMDKVYRELESIIHSDISMLLLGESGTGKTLIARHLHNISREKGDFVKFNASTIPESLAESELFGCKKGAHSEAKHDKPGLFQLADEGTLFIDEIGIMSSDIQGKILTAIDEKEIRRVGDTKPIKVNLRVVGATNVDIKEAIKKGRIREDLFYRFGKSITLPPLRDRKDDIPLAAHFFLDKYTKQYSKNIKGITHEAVAVLQKHKWPDNIRGLENCIKNAVSRAEKKDFLYLTDFIVDSEDDENDRERKKEKEFDTKAETLKEVVCEAVRITLEKNNWHKTKVSKILKISRQNLDNKIDECGIKKPEQI